MSNSETISEKRGRPPALDEDEITRIQSLFPDIRTRSALQNKAFTIGAIAELDQREGAGDYSHFLPSMADAERGKADLPSTLLSQIGRLPPEEMHAVAREICNRKATPKQAIEFAKRWRDMKRKPFFACSLRALLCKTIDDYSVNHDCMPSQVLFVLDDVSEIVSEMVEGDR